MWMKFCASVQRLAINILEPECLKRFPSAHVHTHEKYGQSYSWQINSIDDVIFKFSEVKKLVYIYYVEMVYVQTVKGFSR